VFAIEFDVIMRCFHNVQETNGDTDGPLSACFKSGTAGQIFKQEVLGRESGVYSRRVDQMKNNGESETRLVWGSEKEHHFLRRFLGFARSSFCRVSVKMMMIMMMIIRSGLSQGLRYFDFLN
jgi:hypothetical protein